MAIPLATTTVSIYGRRPQSLNDPDAEGYDPAPPAPTLRASGIRASITAPGAEPNAPQQADTYAFRCDPTNIDRFDLIVDEQSGDTYELRELRDSLPTTWGLEHHVGTLVRVKGLNP